MRSVLLATGLALAAVAAHAMEPPASAVRHPAGSIAFASLAPRGWDIYEVDVHKPAGPRRLTDNSALDYNAAFSPGGNKIAFVSERDGNMEIYVAGVDGAALRRLTNEFAMDDHPTWSPDGRQIAFTSTRQPAEPGAAWNAIYTMNADGSAVVRLSPPGAVDYSPDWSPKGDLIALASGSGKAGESDLYVVRPDGTDRRLVIKDAGWPCFAADGQSLFFHSQRQGKWGVWRVSPDGSGLERITPADVDAFTPCASADGKWLVLALRRGAPQQIELVDLAGRKMVAVTKDSSDHWNPSISADGSRVVYHMATPGFAVPNVELWGAPAETDLKLLRLAGSFPAFSADGKRLALVGGGFADVDVMNLDGSGRKTLYKGTNRGLFSTSWAHHDERIAFAVGAVFEEPRSGVDLMAVRPDGEGLHKLTEHAGNNGFPSFSPDGKQLVFRSGREGSKNLYLMNSDGSQPKQLTHGKWTDTMCDWSPTGDWIAFASDRDGPFEIWLIRPDGSGLRKLVSGGGRNNHPHFSPDGTWIVFTSMRAGYSAEEVSLPSQPQPYGDLFAIGLDGAGLVRLTHNGFEEGTPAWGPVTDIRLSSEGRKPGAPDY